MNCQIVRISGKPAASRLRRIATQLMSRFPSLRRELKGGRTRHTRLHRLEQHLDIVDRPFGDHGAVVLAIANAEVVGAGALRRQSETRGTISRFYVRTDFHGHGIAHRLLVELISASQKKMYRSIAVVLNDSNEHLQSLLLAHGFEHAFSNDEASTERYMLLDF